MRVSDIKLSLLCRDATHWIEKGVNPGTAGRLALDLRDARAENGRLENWVNDLQSGMYINCVYCGHRYGPKDEVECSMQEALYKHIAECPKHPLSNARAVLASIRGMAKWAVENHGWTLPLGNILEQCDKALGERNKQALGEEK